MENKYDVAAFIWPAYTGDEPRTKIFWDEGYGEWQTVKRASAKFEGHEWPRKPLWGYVNEADKYVMQAQIDAAADHGVNMFIYDWYWYDSRPFLENCLNDGYLKANNNDRVKFYLMWANHDATTGWDYRTATRNNPVLWSGVVNDAEYDDICDRVISKYFNHPSYYKIDGSPVFMIYDTENLIKSFGSIDNTRKKLDRFRERAVQAGLNGIYFMFTQWGDRSYNLTNIDGKSGTFISPTSELVTQLGFDGMTNYQFAHFLNIDRNYKDIIRDLSAEWEHFASLYSVPYFPHVSVGWDANPRYKEFIPGIVRENTPEMFKEALVLAKSYVDNHKLPTPLITINSWNEWTETSYLQPDDRNGYGYLEAVRDVFLNI